MEEFDLQQERTISQRKKQLRREIIDRVNNLNLQRETHNFDNEMNGARFLRDFIMPTIEGI